MILIPDIHISAKQGDKILHALETIFQTHDDQDVLFLGDYVYMFSYDRAYLLKLFDLFVRLYQQGRRVLVMAWNHDWISWHFVFQEGKQAFQIISNLGVQHTGNLQFLTQPYCRTDSEDTLSIVIPYNDALTAPQESQYYNPQSLLTSPHHTILETCGHLWTSAKAGDQLSALLNIILLTYYETNKGKYKKIVCYHHYYTARTQFPGVQSRFDFADGAICPEFLDVPWLYIISWHIHEPFSYKNYLCCGSLWHTSSSEQNECKYYAVWNISDGFDMRMIHINPSALYDCTTQESDASIQLHDIQNHMLSITQESCDRMAWPLVSQVSSAELLLSDLSLTLKTKKWVSYDTVIDKVVADQVRSYRYMSASEHELDASFTVSSAHDFRISIADRKTLLSDYLSHKYPESQQSYMDFMKTNNIV